MVVGRQVLSDFDAAVAKAAKQAHTKEHGSEDDVMTDAKTVSAIADDDVHQQVLQMALDKVQPRVLSFEEQVCGRERWVWGVFWWGPDGGEG